jgi:hypothetical protein
MSLNWNIGRIRDYHTVCFDRRVFDTPEEAEAFIRAETSFMGPNWYIDTDDEAGRTAKRMSVTTNMLIWASLLVGLPEITEANAERWYKRLATIEANNGAYRTRDGEDVPFTLDEVRAHIGLSTNVSRETDAKFRAKVKRWEAETAARAARAAAAAPAAP